MQDNPLGVILNEDRLDAFKASEQKLYVIAGASRGGTSALAYTLRRCGVQFGDVIESNHEPLAVMRDTTEETIQTHVRSLSGPSIGIKLPALTWHLRWLDKTYENAMFLFVVRNPLDVAKSIMTRDAGHDFSTKSFAYGLEHAWTYYIQFAKRAQELSRPAAVLSHEKMIANPQHLFALLATVGVEVRDPVALARDLSRPGYKAVKETEHEPNRK